MFSRIRRAFNQDDPTPDELRALFQIRRDCLDLGTSYVTGDAPLPVSERWGWGAWITRLGRDQDGSLLASVTVKDPDGIIRVERSVRLVPRRRLNY